MIVLVSAILSLEYTSKYIILLCWFVNNQGFSSYSKKRFADARRCVWTQLLHIWRIFSNPPGFQAFEKRLGGNFIFKNPNFLRTIERCDVTGSGNTKSLSTFVHIHDGFSIYLINAWPYPPISTLSPFLFAILKKLLYSRLYRKCSHHRKRFSRNILYFEPSRKPQRLFQ